MGSKSTLLTATSKRFAALSEAGKVAAFKVDDVDHHQAHVDLVHHIENHGPHVFFVDLDGKIFDPIVIDAVATAADDGFAAACDMRGHVARRVRILRLQGDPTPLANLIGHVENPQVGRH